ncbi:MAG: Polysaccharide export protein, partial [uncultured bacterium]
PRVSVSGSVNTPAAFELKAGEMELGKVLLLAGGFSSGSGSHRIEVVRISDSKRLTVFSAEVHSGADIPAFSLESGDRIYVSRISSGAEKVYMQLPGQPRRDIAYRPNIRVSDLIAALNPLPENVALNYAEVLREGRSDKKYDVIGISIDVLLQQIKAGDMSQDLIMRPGDRLMLFDREFLDKKPVVGLEIKGQPLMLIDFKPGMKISDLLECSNLMLPSGKLRANIHRRQLNGSRLDVVSLVVELNAVRRRNQRQDIELQPFDTLMIQR